MKRLKVAKNQKFNYLIDKVSEDCNDEFNIILNLGTISLNNKGKKTISLTNNLISALDQLVSIYGTNIKVNVSLYGLGTFCYRNNIKYDGDTCLNKFKQICCDIKNLVKMYKLGNGCIQIKPAITKFSNGLEEGIKPVDGIMTSQEYDNGDNLFIIEDALNILAMIGYNKNQLGKLLEVGDDIISLIPSNLVRNIPYMNNVNMLRYKELESMWLSCF